jgi:lysine-ketoglutarate reductase/saccharopine dehydrogenase-like protein (TIGR00300 family)
MNQKFNQRQIMSSRGEEYPLFSLPEYHHPDFTSGSLASSPAVSLKCVERDGIAPDNFHATSNHPEYVHLGNGKWVLTSESRMDCCIVRRGDTVVVVEPRSLKKGDAVIVGRTENGEEGIFVHTHGFRSEREDRVDKFTFRTRGTRETPFSRSYDVLYDLMRHDRDHGYIVWVLGPAVAFDKDSRNAMQGLIEAGYCDALLAGNALATHDLEAAYFGTGLGQDIYDQTLKPMGHYNHLDILNVVKRFGSIPKAIKELKLCDGIIYACEASGVPYVLAGSIRDDGPLSEVIADVYAAQDAMRHHARKATMVIAMATQLHSIAFGNMTPGYRVMEDGSVRPVYFFIVDISEFSTDKLANRGSIQAEAILTNVQDFIVNLWHNLAQDHVPKKREMVCRKAGK